MSGFVFHDPSGKRARRAAWVGGLIGASVVMLLAAFAVTLATSPTLPRVDYRSPRSMAAVHPEYRRHKEISWLKALQKRGAPVPNTGGARPLVVGFYVPTDPDSRASLQEHVNQLDVLSPQWITLASPAGDIKVDPDPYGRAIVRAARKRPAVVPLLINTSPDPNGGFNGAAANNVILNPAARARLVAQVVQLAVKNDWAGVAFDFEDMSRAGLAAYPELLREARLALAPHGKQVWVTVIFDDADWDPAKLAPYADQVVLMAYDEHFGTSAPGPIAGQGWYEQHLADRTRTLDPNHTIIALGSYGYDWIRGGRAEARTFHEATISARDSSAPIQFDVDALNPYFSYEEDGVKHDVWFLDAVTLFNQIQVTDSWRPRGYALWRLGQEDPGVWSILGKPYGEATADGLKVLSAGTNVDFEGAGEILRVVGTPGAGLREMSVDPASELVSRESYAKIPSAYSVQRLGAEPRHENQVAITFDDGPDGRWTPKILDILKRKHAAATFFVIGENMERRPDLVVREVNEGHDVGSHTFTHPNIGQVPLAEAALELNATQRLFETLTSRSLRLFRPPYMGDADPSTSREVAPLLLAQSRGYVNVGLRVDPDDWLKPRAEVIVANVLDQLARPRSADTPPGRVILLHDSGGDRKETVRALPMLIDQLRAHGYQIVPVSHLADLTAAQAMPATDRNSIGLAIDRAAFFLVRNGATLLQILLGSAIVIGVLRLLFLTVFSLAHAVRSGRSAPPVLQDADRRHVSVLIPCFNEQAVIESSISRILASDWPHLEVLVLDDGSTDRTAEVVERAFGGDPRVRVMRFENGGKARALNRGLTCCAGEIVVALDADTQFAPETIGRLARWFADPRIGAVAGNALVGNRMNLITRWQALEYVTAQNLERRALAVLGAVTVVPGAVGAWRRDALEALGGYPTDTLAEDQDLTIAVQQAGWKVTFDPEALAFTESPDTVRGLLKQRFRWSFGTLQCLWKHRSGLFKRKNWALGWVALPQVWLFQIVLTVIAPLVDLAVVWQAISAYMAARSHPLEYSSDDLIRAVAYWLAFILLDLAAGIVGMVMEPRAPWKDLPWLPLQRFGYRQLMYYVVVRAVDHAIRGRRVGWGKLERRASVAVPASRPAKAPRPEKAKAR